MKILVETLDEFAKAIQSKETHQTLLILQYSQRIIREMVKAGESKRLGEYFGVVETKLAQGK